MNKESFQRWARLFASELESHELNLVAVTDQVARERQELEAGVFAADPQLVSFLHAIGDATIAHHQVRRDMATYLRARLEGFDGSPGKK